MYGAWKTSAKKFRNEFRSTGLDLAGNMEKREILKLMIGQYHPFDIPMRTYLSSFNSKLPILRTLP